MNEAAKLVSDSVLGEDFITIKIGKKAYTVYPPAIKTLCRAVSEFSKIGMDGEYNQLTVLAELPENVPHIIKGISTLIVGDVKCWRWKSHRVGKTLKSLNLHELKKVIEDVLPLLGGDAFFACAASLKSMSKIAAHPKL
ncbi:MAG TPA: hypothetical protein DHW31_02945 [Bacteroides graminisolvens]|uniref:Uncharacterized protein n=1 Tax=Bacteroides graminisolvens TaxID=477666 RepID=A0A3D2SEF8_9BACE|nr:hypothetical protein [uncultured Bacteroides sp.]MDD3238650.1 hypothetical protein [Lachnospira sp.]MDD4636121.1 hypothetical protein [Bacteroidales bacterium]HCK23731.1 hypothetical protein [Bacteroides graminisolvens]